MGKHDIIADALKRIGDAPGLAPELYELLRDRPLLVPVNRIRQAPDAAEVSVIALWRNPADGMGFVPLFSAPARVPAGAPPNTSLVWDTLHRLTAVLPNADFRINPAGPIAYDLSSALARRIVGAARSQGAPEGASIAKGEDISLGRVTEDHGVLVAALQNHFARQQSAPAIYLYELYRSVDNRASRSLAIGVVSGFDTAVALAIEAIVPEAYCSELPVDVHFLGGNPEVIEALEDLAILPIVRARSPSRGQ